jgi:hypothetical protein
LFSTREAKLAADHVSAIMRSVTARISTPHRAPTRFGDADAIKTVCAALALAILVLGFRIAALW